MVLFATSNALKHTYASAKKAETNLLNSRGSHNSKLISASETNNIQDDEDDVNNNSSSNNNNGSSSSNNNNNGNSSSNNRGSSSNRSKRLKKDWNIGGARLRPFSWQA